MAQFKMNAFNRGVEFTDQVKTDTQFVHQVKTKTPSSEIAEGSSLYHEYVFKLNDLQTSFEADEASLMTPSDAEDTAYAEETEAQKAQLQANYEARRAERKAKHDIVWQELNKRYEPDVQPLQTYISHLDYKWNQLIVREIPTMNRRGEADVHTENHPSAR